MTYGATVEIKEGNSRELIKVCNLLTQIEAEKWLATEIKRQKSLLRKVTDHYLQKFDN